MLSGEFSTVNKWLFSSIARHIHQKSNRLVMGYEIFIFLMVAIISTAGFFLSTRVEHINFTTKVIAPYFISALYIAFLILITENIIKRFFVDFETQIMVFIKSTKDMETIEERVTSMFSKRKQILFGIFFSLIIHMVFIAPNMDLLNTFGWGIIVANIILNFFHGICSYFLYAYMKWAYNELRHYDFELYALNPSSSEVIHILSRKLNFVLYNVVILIAIVSSAFILFDVFPILSVLISLAIMWITASVIFVFNQNILATIIQKGKWRTLRELQGKIMNLENQEDIPAPETLEQIEKLSTLHDKVKSTPDSALNIKSFLEFLNSLFLPTIGVLITSAEDILNFIKPLNE
jgi:hypothetical protein